MSGSAATNVGWHPSDPPLYEGKHRDDSHVAWSRQYRAASHVLVYGHPHKPRHSAASWVVQS